MTVTRAHSTQVAIRIPLFPWEVRSVLRPTQIRLVAWSSLGVSEAWFRHGLSDRGQERIASLGAGCRPSSLELRRRRSRMLSSVDYNLMFNQG